LLDRRAASNLQSMKVEEDLERETKSIMVRVRPRSFTQLVTLAKKAGMPVATLCRRLIEGALEEGVEIVPRNGAGR